MKETIKRNFGLRYLLVFSLGAFAACSDDDPATTNNNTVDMGPDATEDVGMAICTPYETKCDGDDILKCDADGMKWDALSTCAEGEACMDGACTIIAGIESLTASVVVIQEGSTQDVDLLATHKGTPSAHAWRQIGGPAAGLTDGGADNAKVNFGNIEVAGDTVFSFELEATWTTDTPGALVATDVATVDVVVQAVDLVPAREAGQIGGATVAAVELEQDGNTYALYNQGGRLQATLIDVSDAEVYALNVGAYIRGIDVVEYGGAKYALLALGAEGIGVVNITDVTAMTNVTRVGVNYEKLGMTYTEGGGSIVVGDIVGTRSNITALETDGTSLWIANADFGLQRTALSNLLDATPVLEADGTLMIDAEQFTQLYAGEKAWGGLLSLTQFGGKLFAAQAFMGMGIFDPDTLEQVGRYNMYVDTSVTEDWFVDMDLATQVHDDGGLFIDAFTGMPDYRQANYEVEQVWKGGVVAPTPWADFDRYGKYYYNSGDVAVADAGGRTIAYIAYGLGGVVAVDVTGYDTATAASFLVGDYLGYAPGVPAHGPDEPRRDETKSLYPYYGAGMLKEAGATAVSVVGNDVIYTDHFAGLVILENAASPDTAWRQNGGPFNNDKPAEGGGPAVLGDHFPDYEWVTSYDMSPYDPADHESLPTWMYESPALLTTGELGGHGRGFTLLSTADLNATGSTDILVIAGSGGLSMVDLDMTGPTFADRFTVLRSLRSSDEIGAAADGTPTSPVNIGHTQSVTTTAGYLYVGDGPHGVTAWDILDDNGMPIDDPHVVGNTLQDEYPEVVNGVTIYPATHAWGVLFDETENAIYATCQSVGLRRVSVATIEAGEGAVGAPVLVGPKATDIFEHNGEAGSINGFSGQDHAYDVFRRGDLAFVADGTNGLTIYDVTKDPTDLMSGFVVGNVGSESGRPPLGRAAGITVWSGNGKDYAFMAAGQYGIGVVDVTDVTSPQLVKVFEPIKLEEDKVGKADGRSVDVHVVGDNVFFSYTSFGLVSYSLADLIEPLPAGTDPTEIWKSGSDGTVEFDYRPVALDRFLINEVPGLEEISAEALYMEYSNVAGRLLFYVAYGEGGVAIIDWTDPANAELIARMPTIHSATAVALRNGRLYVADYDGGIAIFK